MIWHFLLVDDDYGTRVGDGLGIKASRMRLRPDRLLT